LTARRLDRLESIKTELSAKYPSIAIHITQLDVREKVQIDKVVSELPEEVKNIDVLLNNAGMVIGVDPLVEVEESAIDQMLATNVKGLVLLTQAIVPGMKKRGVGHVINIGSIAGKQAYAGGSIYCATKYAVDAITKTLLLELVDTPLRVSQICPGLVNTEFSTVRFRGDKDKADNVYKGIQPLVADDIAELIVFTAGRPAHVNIADMLGKLAHKYCTYSCI
jgi:NADP-dependent 3-hydroxy acid dehydrogenase YdfG